MRLRVTLAPATAYDPPPGYIGERISAAAIEYYHNTWILEKHDDMPREPNIYGTSSSRLTI